MIKNFLLILICCFTVHLTFAHSNYDSIGIIKKNNQVFILHKVTKGQTIYAIARKYNTDIHTVRKYNPTTVSDAYAVHINDVLYIPSKNQIKQSSVSSQSRSKKIYSSKTVDDILLIKSYKIKEGDNLYNIALQYGTTVEKIKALNNITSNDLHLGQLILMEVPQKHEVKPLSEIKKSYLHCLPEQQNNTTRKVNIHKVRSGDHLYKIAIMYHKTMADLRTLNCYSEKTPQFKIGQKVIIDYKDSINHLSKQLLQVEIVNKTLEDENISSISTLKLVKQSGICVRLPKTSTSTKKLALHATAPEGTYIIVYNPATKNEVQVRVIAKLTKEDIDNNVIIKISNSAWETLGDPNDKFPVRISYNK